MTIGYILNHINNNGEFMTIGDSFGNIMIYQQQWRIVQNQKNWRIRIDSHGQ